MANPWSMAATGCVVVVVGWLLSPIIRWLLQNLFAYLIFDASKELPELKFDTIPALKLTLREVDKQRMLRAGRDDQGSRSDLKILDKMDMRLNSALCQAEDILDLADYHRIEKEVARWDGSNSVKRLLRAAGASIIPVCRGSWILVQPLLHAAGNCVICWMGCCLEKGMRQRIKYILQGKWISHIYVSLLQNGGMELTCSRDLLPVSQAITFVVEVESLCCCCSLLVANIITCCCRCVHSWCTDRIADARYYRNRSYEQVSFKINEQKVGIVPITEAIRLRKQIEGIKYILTSSKKTNLLNHAKDDVMESSSNCTVKNGGDESSSSKQKQIHELYRVIIGRKVFGRDKDRADISRMLREGPDTYAASSSTYAASSSTSKPYSVIGIVGITSSGKTTLAQYVCEYEKKAGHFNPIMFIHVGKTFSVDHIFRDLLNQSKGKDLQCLKVDLEEALKDKRFLLVLDDLWINGKTDVEQGILLKALCAGQSGSKILVTAENKDAAAALGAQQQFEIPDLDEESYFSMFMHHALQNTAVDDYGKYEQIGRRVAKQLQRSHIAAVTVAQRLHVNNSISFWEATASNDVLHRTTGALWWSYMQLDAVVRRCFVYLSTFPQGYVFKRKIVVDLWIAQGFVESSEETEDMEALGHSYFDTLLAFAFLQGDVFFGPSRCTMHDELHKLAVTVAGTESFRIPVNDRRAEKIPSQVQHLFIETYNIADIRMEKILQLGNLRTLIILEKPNNKMKANSKAGATLVLAELFGSMFMKLRKLRVLIIKKRGYTELVRFTVAATISKMKHLRYLVLRNVYPIFPRTLTRLYHMQILDVPHHADLLVSAEDMGNLIHLRLIRGFPKFPNIGRLKLLREIPGEQFHAYWGEGYELKQLKHLNKIQGALLINFFGFPTSKDDPIEARLAIKNRLTELSLFFCNCSSDPDVFDVLCPPGGLEWLMIWGYSGSRYPSWMSSSNHGDTRKHLGLVFKECTTQLESIPEDSNFWIHVRTLCLENCTWDWLPDMEHLVSLEVLQIKECNNIVRLPTMPWSLQEISIIYCSVLSTTCQQPGHINWSRIQHIRWKEIEAKPVDHLNQCGESPCTQVPGSEVIFRSHEVDDQQSEHKALDRILSNTTEEPIGLSYAFLQKITRDFSQEIGRGGFGVVYMGSYERRNIAVKKLWVPKDLSDMKFEEELKCLIRVKHENIVRFLGYCSDTIEKPIEYNGKLVVAEEWQRFLCFEYVPNKSLRDYLKDESHGHEWDIRYQLISGICQGLCYLHNKERIIHLDLKPENILLDDDMVPKIADFGISRLFTAEKSRTITKKILGSRPYMAPEYLNKGVITFKCDIFSLGVILKELLLGNNDFSNHENWHQSPDIDNPQLKRCIEVAQMCVNEDPSKRPDIDCIINMLSE